MRNSSPTSSFSGKETPLTTLISCAVMLLCCLCSAAFGQSGRRVIKAPAAPAQPVADSSAKTEEKGQETTAEAPMAATTAATATTAEGEKPAAQVKLLIACKIPDKDAAELIRGYFLRRLNEASNVTASFVGKMARNEAQKRAQSEAEANVVWLEIETDNVQKGDIYFMTPDLAVKYQVFAPGTAQVKSKGKVYYQPANGARTRSGDWPSGTPVRITPEAAGIAAAELVLDGIRLADLRK